MSNESGGQGVVPDPRAKALRVLFLTRYPVLGASSRYRVYQYIPHLSAAGVECTVQSFMSPAMYGLSFQSGRQARKLLATVLAMFARLKAIAGFRRYDIIYMQRELFPFGPPVVERWLKKRGAVLVFDYDDALFIKKASRYNPIATWLRSPDKVRRIFETVDMVVAGNDWLRDEARKSGVAAETVEVAEDTSRITAHAAHTNSRPVTIGWLGSSSTVKYLRAIEPVLQDLAREHPQLKFEIMGGGDFLMPGVDWKLTPWSLEGELEALKRFDIGLMPLPSEDWAKGKSGGKARTYMAAGVVPVCSAIGYNLELVDHGRTGFLCASPEEWRAAISSLIRDEGLRQRVATAARSDVEVRFSPAGQAARLRGIFDRLVARAQA